MSGGLDRSPSTNRPSTHRQSQGGSIQGSVHDIRAVSHAAPPRAPCELRAASSTRGLRIAATPARGPRAALGAETQGAGPHTVRLSLTAAFDGSWSAAPLSAAVERGGGQGWEGGSAGEERNYKLPHASTPIPPNQPPGPPKPARPARSAKLRSPGPLGASPRQGPRSEAHGRDEATPGAGRAESPRPRAGGSAPAPPGASRRKGPGGTDSWRRGDGPGFGSSATDWLQRRRLRAQGGGGGGFDASSREN